MRVLQAQSTLRYTLLKNVKKGTYYILRHKDKKKALIGDKNDAEWFILYGIAENKEDLQTLKFE